MSNNDYFTKGVKRCPFCGSQARVEQRIVYKNSAMVYTGKLVAMTVNLVKCPRCHVQTNTYRFSSDAIKAWNRRVSNV